MHRLWDVGCPALVDYPDKGLYLRQSHAYFLKGTKASYECSAGHITNNGSVDELTLTCQMNGNWSADPDTLPACHAVTCGPVPNATELTGTLTYLMSYGSNSSLLGTSFTYACPQLSSFVNKITHFQAVCEPDG